MLRIAIRESAGERVLATERDEILVGSREGADLRLSDPGAAPNHLILRAESGRVRLLSLSAKGAALGGRRIAEAMLDPGDEFAVGSTILRILASSGASRLALEEPPAAPPKPPPPPPPSAPPAHDSDFAREVQAAVAKAPWYMISLAVHVLILLALNAIEYRQPVGERGTHMTGVPRGDEATPEIVADERLDLSKLDEPLNLLEQLDLDEPVSEAVSKTPSEADLTAIDDPMPPDRIGLRGGRPSVKALDKPLPYSKIKGGDQALNRGDLEGEQGRATDEVKRGLGDGLHEARARLSREHIWVVRGAHDKIEALLDGYGWPHTLVSRDELLLRGCPQARILFVNCNNRPPPEKAPKIAELVKKLLLHGCWVVTSDWSVEPYLTEPFPGIVKAVGAQRSQRDTTVSVEAVCSDELLAGVFPRTGGSLWWLEDSSTMVWTSDKATILVASEDMRGRYGSRVVALKFPYGKGLAVHLVGHFYQKDGNLHGLVAMHRLINNLIVERVRADQAR